MTAKVTYTYSGSPLNFNFPSFDKSHIQVSVNDALVNNYTVSNYTTGLSNNRVSSGGGGTITFSPDITVGDSVVIFRATPSNIFVNFQDGATLTASELNLNNTAQAFRTDELILEAGSTPGPQGLAGTVAVSPTTTTGNPGTDASVTNTGTASAAVLAFTIPRGNAGTPATITSATAVAGTTAGVTLGGTPSARTFEFTLPKGDDGTGLNIQGTLTHTGAPTSTEAPSPSVGDLYIDSNGDGFLYNQNNQWQNVGAIRGPQGLRGDGFTGGSYDASTGVVTFTSSDNLGFTTGDLRGATVAGPPGTPATIAAGSVTFGSPAAVTNSGTSSAAVFDFTLPQLWTTDSNTPANIYYPNNVAIGANSTNTNYTLYVNGSADVNGALTANSFTGSGSGLTNVDAATLGGSNLATVLSNSSGSISVGTNQPSNASEGDLWWNPTTLRMYVRYNDGTSFQWVDTNPPSPGVAPNVSIGTVSTLTSGSNATASITGTTPNLSLNLGIPRGTNGVSPAISIGSVSTLSSGSNATASISGTAPNFTLNFGIPRGEDGEDGVDGTVSNSISGNFSVSNDITVGNNFRSNRSAGSGGAFIGTYSAVLSAEGGDISFFRQGTRKCLIRGSTFDIENADLRVVSIATSSNAANTYLTSDGKFRRVSSSLQYKHTVEDHSDVDATRFLEQTRPVTFYSLSEEDDAQHFGFIAEEMELVEPRYVEYDESGQPDSVQYSAIVATLTKICQMQEQRIKALEDRLNG